MATYVELTKWVKAKYSYSPKTCWIAHMKAECGLPVRQAHNRLGPDQREVPCPDGIGAPHVGERSEKALITAFVDRIAELNPQLITFNGNSFDLPVVRYRAMINEVSAPGLSMRSYFNRYSEDALDLCDALSSFSPNGKATMHEISLALGLTGKPEGIDGSEVAGYFQAGRIKEIADYCETDVTNTYQIWLRYELFRGKLTEAQFRASEADLRAFILGHKETKPHLQYMTAS